MGDIASLSKEKSVEFLSSGNDAIDALTGGIPRARMTEIVGAEGLGKSTLVSTFAAKLSQSGRVLYVDAEQSLNKDRVEQLGGDLTKIDYTASHELEKVAELVTTATPKYDAIIIDSIATLVPKNILEGNIGDMNIGLYARQMSKWVKQLKPALKETGCAMVCVNQYRQSPDMFKPKYIPGGTAYMHALDLRLELTSTPSKDKIMKDKDRVGHWVNVTVTKSRVSQPYQKTKYKLIYKVV